MDTTGLTIHEFGFLLKYSVVRGDFPVSTVALQLYCTHFGKVIDALQKDVLPLPVEPPTPEEERVTKALSAGTAVPDLSRNFPKTFLVVGRAAWISLVVMVVNCLDLGRSMAHMGLSWLTWWMSPPLKPVPPATSASRWTSSLSR